MCPIISDLLGAALGEARPLSAAAEFISSLSPGLRAATPFISAGVHARLSTSSIINTLRSSGFKFSNASGRKLVQYARNSLQAGQYVRNLKPNVLPDPTRINASQYFLKSRYVYTVKLNVLLNETGAASVEYVNISTDSLMTHDQLAERVDYVLQNSVTDYNMRLMSAEVDTLLVDPRFLP